MWRTDPESIRAITGLMFVPDDVLDADATIVLGMTLWQRPLQRAMALHRDGLAGALVFSGGFNQKIGDSEAVRMRNRWVEDGNPETSVLVDAHSGNTLENMENSRRLLAQRGLLGHGTRINLISINYHMRRAVETFREVFGPEPELGIANYPSEYCDPRDWFDNNCGRQLVLGEATKICTYLPDRAGRLGLDELLAA